ncbi:MAG: SPOR domain-containing protein [Pseudomonadota bacterium]
MTTSSALSALKLAFLTGSMALVSACAHDATSDLAQQTLDAADSQMTVLDLGYAAAARGDHSSAIQYFRSAHAQNLAYSTADGGALLGLGQSLLAIGQNGDAAKIFIKAAKAGNGAPALRGLAQAQLHLGQPGLAVESARRAVQLDPNDAKAMGILGISMDVMGDHQEAAAIYTDAMTRFPGSLALASNHGLSMVMTGDMDVGTRLLEDVVRDPRARARDRQNLALAYALSGDYDRAAALSAIDLDVTGVRANLLYADMLRAMSPKARLATLVTGAQSPKTDNTQNANAIYLRGDNAAWVEASIRRLVPDEGSADLAGVPPLMDPTGWAVQIAAYRKLEHLAPGWAYLSSKYAAIIGGLEPRRSEVTHPPATKGPVGFYHRLNAGPLRTKQEALDICAKMKARGADCWVRPPTMGEGRLPSDEMARNDSAPEGTYVKSSDYNAVVNQFARAMVMKSREDAPATTRDLPAVMTADLPPVSPASNQPADVQEVAPAATPDVVAAVQEAAPAPAKQAKEAATAARVDAQAADDALEMPAVEKVAEAKEDVAAPVPAATDTSVAPQPAAKAAEETAAEPQEEVAQSAVDSVPAPSEKPAPPTVVAEAAEETQNEEGPVRSVAAAEQNLEQSLTRRLEDLISQPALDEAATSAPVAPSVPQPPVQPAVSPATVKQISGMEPSAGVPEQASEAKVDALRGVFDALEQAETQTPKTQAPARLPVTHVAPDSALTEAPSPGKIIPAMKRFNDTPQNLSYINMSGDIRPGFQETGAPKAASGAVGNGVY